MGRTDRLLLSFLEGNGVYPNMSLRITKSIKTIRQLWLLAIMSGGARYGKNKKMVNDRRM